MALTDSTLKAYIKRTLGSDGTSGVDVEMTDTQLQDCVDDALDIYSRMKPKRGIANIPVSRGIELYDLSTLLSPIPKGVIDVVFHNTGANLSAPEFTSLLAQMPYFPYGDIQQLATARTWIKTQARITNSETEWLYEDATKRLYIANVPTDADKAMLDCTYDQVIGDIPKSEERYLKNLALAEAMLRLSRIRGKYVGVPTPGGNISMNAKELFAEGTALRQETIDSIQRTSLEPTIFVG